VGHRTFELYQPDVTDLGFHVDMLVLSALADEYDPIPGTMIGSLHNREGLDLALLARDPCLDFLLTLG
jgi:hypothetical protein